MDNKINIGTTIRDICIKYCINIDISYAFASSRTSYTFVNVSRIRKFAYLPQMYKDIALTTITTK